MHLSAQIANAGCLFMSGCASPLVSCPSVPPCLGRVKFVPENYTTNYTSPSSGCDCHVAADTDKVSPKTSHFRTFELSQYYLYELSGSTVTERPRQICPYVIVAFQYREPKKMAAPAPHHNSVLELKENVLISPWKGKLIIQGCLLCDITLWSSYGTVVPTQLTPAGANKGPDSPTTLKLVKGQFPQKRKRGAEVLTAQFVQTTKLDRKNQDAPVSKDVPVATDAKRARKQEKPPVKTVPWAKPPVKKSPQKQRFRHPCHEEPSFRGGQGSSSFQTCCCELQRGAQLLFCPSVHLLQGLMPRIAVNFVLHEDRSEEG
ncbi:hypothetical protein CB1_001581010 [Camelus ferus]|nr:hypothetical protein CB1_001581010 [Camelus ferus]